MGPVSVFVFFSSLGLLVILASKLQALRSDPEFERYDWSLRLGIAVCAFFFLASIIGLLEAYRPTDSPFDPPSEESLRSHPREVPEAKSLNLEPKDSRPRLDEVRREHRGQLETFKDRALQ